MNTQLALDDGSPFPLRRPADAVELGEIVRAAAEKEEGVFPIGGRTQLDLGNPPSKPGIAIEFSAFNTVVDYPSRDLTITIQAGMKISELRRVLAGENQTLPIDVYGPDSTIGGAIATNRSGPRRLGHGTFRDAILGIAFINDLGLEVHGGGRVVKNVAGYDLMKLHTGALGSFGILTEITLKVKPQPESSAWVAFGLNSTGVGPTLDRLHASTSRPIALELLNLAAIKRIGIPGLPLDDPWVIVCGFEEKQKTLDWQIQSLNEELRTAPVRGIAEYRDEAGHNLRDALTDLGRGFADFWTVKANTFPSQIAAITSAMLSENAGAIIHAHAGNGIAYAHWPVNSVDRASTAIADLSGKLIAANSNLVVVRCPTAWKPSLPIWGRETSSDAIRRAVKQALDPKGVFNPGRI